MFLQNNIIFGAIYLKCYLCTHHNVVFRLRDMSALKTLSCFGIHFVLLERAADIRTIEFQNFLLLNDNQITEQVSVSKHFVPNPEVSS